MKRRKIIGYYDYTVVLTYLGLIYAFLGILFAINEAYRESILSLMAAGICDMFDGTIAATKDRNKSEKHFGIQIDSLCDLVSFGVLPAIFVYMISGKNVVVAILACLYTLCGLIRLAYYNVQEYERQQVMEGKRETFTGVPITASAIVLPIAYLMYSHYDFIGVWIFTLIVILLGTGFISNIEIRKPKLVGKIVMIIAGLVELVGVFVLTGIA